MKFASGVLTVAALVLVGYLLRQNQDMGGLTVWWPWCWVVAGAVAVSMLGRSPQLTGRWTGRGMGAAVGVPSLVVGVWFATGDVPETTPGVWFYPWLQATGGLWLLCAAGRRFRFGSARTGFARWRQRRGRRGGFASAGQILLRASRWTMRRKAKVLRPSLREVSWLRRTFMTRTREYATAVARVGLLKVWSPVEDVTLRVGGPRTGKTGELAGRILDAPGAVIATSTRTDLVELTSELRAKKGPVRVFNPSALGGLANSISFDPLAGCADPKTAVQRAEDLLSGAAGPGSGGDMEFWLNAARRVLASLLHAAALAERDMATVLAWVGSPKSATADIQRALARSTQPTFKLVVDQFLGTNDRTQSSICATMMPALGWLTDAAAVACTRGEHPLNVVDLIEQCGTVYMLGAEDGQTAPLVAALTGHIAREARRLAAAMPGGRLDPPLTMALDEAALICPVPLDRWSADFGGRGVQLHIAVQGRSQLQQRWGREGAAIILTNTGTLLVFGASKDADDLQAYADLTGTRWEDAPADPGQSPVPQRVPTLTPAEISQLRPGRVLIIRRGMPPALGRVRMAWKRGDVRAHRAGLRLAAAADRLGTWRRRATTAGRTAASATRDAAAPTANAAMQRWQTMRNSQRSAHTPASVTRLHHDHRDPVEQTAGSAETARPLEQQRWPQSGDRGPVGGHRDVLYPDTVATSRTAQLGDGREAGDQR